MACCGCLLLNRLFFGMVVTCLVLLCPIFENENPEANLKLAKLWDVNGLLALFDAPCCPGAYSRVFQVYKDAHRDRQIGDRRLPNAMEYHVAGPSKHLPPGHLLAELHVDVKHDTLRGSVTDRRDFYHQSKVTDA